MNKLEDLIQEALNVFLNVGNHPVLIHLILLGDRELDLKCLSSQDSKMHVGLLCERFKIWEVTRFEY